MLNAISESRWQRIFLTQSRSSRRGMTVLTVNGKERLSQKMLMPESDMMVGGHVTVCSEGFVVWAIARCDA